MKRLARCADTSDERMVAFRSRLPDDKRGTVLIHFRLMQAADEQRLLDFFHSHTEATIHLRYGMMIREITHERALALVQLDGYNELALVGLVGPPGAERIVAVGRYGLDTATNLAEIAFVVHEHYRGLGIATQLTLRLVEIIRDQGFSGITVQALPSNTPMLQVLHEVLGRADQTTSGGGEITLVYRFKALPGKPVATSAPRAQAASI